MCALKVNFMRNVAVVYNLTKMGEVVISTNDIMDIMLSSHRKYHSAFYHFLCVLMHASIY